MTVQQIPLSERIETTKRGKVCQASYCDCLIRQWAETPIKAYFGRSSSQWRMLFRRLGLPMTANPTYQEVAVMIARDDVELTEELYLLASPIWEAAKRRAKT